MNLKFIQISWRPWEFLKIKKNKIEKNRNQKKRPRKSGRKNLSKWKILCHQRDTINLFGKSHQFFIDVGDGYWMHGVWVFVILMCWWPIYRIKKVTNIMLLSSTRKPIRKFLNVKILTKKWSARGVFPGDYNFVKF